ncbi:hypothetical protein F7725_000730 [Dissostichus mawsoni]|uniref:Uncharacterized protein n=1 Tax=Dissostichus mawsoni TaxID=36200 RepID=A0A7J5ZF88_DISMA|nr:hypothetical protein F7725_000730 [Dissostichus mawsoni]
MSQTRNILISMELNVLDEKITTVVAYDVVPAYAIAMEDRRSKGGVVPQVLIGRQTPSLHSSRQAPLFLCLRTCSAALVAISNTSRTPSLVFAEHSR